MTSSEKPSPESPELIDMAAITPPGATAPPEAAATPENAVEETISPAPAQPHVETLTREEPAAGESPDLEFEDEAEEEAPDGTGTIFDTELARLLSTPDGIKSAIEALLFASPEPLTPHRITRTLELSDTKLVAAMLTELIMAYQDQPRGMQILETSEGYQMATREIFGDLILRLKNRKRRPALSAAALETLAIIAYRQPLIRADVEAVRGVESSGTIRNLIDMGLVEMVGRKEVLGRPPMYGTTEQFLKSFGLRNLSDLPPIGELKRRFIENEKAQQEQEAANAAKAAAAPAATPAGATADGAVPATPPPAPTEPQISDDDASAEAQPASPEGNPPGEAPGAAETEITEEDPTMAKKESQEPWNEDEDEKDEEDELDEDEDEDDEEYDDDDINDLEDDEDEEEEDEDEEYDEDEEEDEDEDELEEDEDEDEEYDDDDINDLEDEEDEDEDEEEADDEEDQGPGRGRGGRRRR